MIEVAPHPLLEIQAFVTRLRQPLGSLRATSDDIGGLLCLWDAHGPSAGGVKDSQRTKTHEQTRRSLSMIWGTKDLPGRVEQAAAWYRQLLEECDCQTELAKFTSPR